MSKAVFTGAGSLSTHEHGRVQGLCSRAVFTGRVHGLCSRAVNKGRIYGPCLRASEASPVNTAMNTGVQNERPCSRAGPTAREREKERRKNEEYLYSAIYTMHSLKELRHGSHSFTCKLHHTRHSFVSVHQMAPPLTEVADIQLQFTAHLSIPKGSKAALARLVDL